MASMTNLENNKKLIDFLIRVDEEKYKDVRIEGNDLKFNSYSIPLDLINLDHIIESNERLKTELYTMKVEDLFKILEINAIMLRSALKTGNYRVYENNAKIVNKMKQTNAIMKNISVINKESSFLTEQYINIVDSRGKVHTFKNTNAIDISEVLYEYLSKTHEQNLDFLIELLGSKTPELDMTVSVDLKDNSNISEDFKNKLREVQKEFEGKPGVHILGNEEENIITIVDPLNPQNNETRTYKRNEKNDIVTEKYKTNEEFRQISEKELEETEKEKVQFEKQDDIEKNTDVEDISKEEKVIELIPYEELFKLINKQTELSEEEKEQVELWNQTLADIYIYEDYLSEEVVSYLKKYQEDMQKLELIGKEYPLNKNQEEAIKNFYEITDISLRNEKLANMSEERKNDTTKKLTRQMSGMDKAGKLSLNLILTMLIISMALIAYIVIVLT